MIKKPFLVVLMGLASMIMLAQTATRTAQSQLPQIKLNGAVKQMFVDGKPFR